MGQSGLKNFLTYLYQSQHNPPKVRGADIPAEELESEVEMTNRQCRQAELLRQHSSRADLVVVTLPLPKYHCPHHHLSRVFFGVDCRETKLTAITITITIIITITTTLKVINKWVPLLCMVGSSYSGPSSHAPGPRESTIRSYVLFVMACLDKMFEYG